MPRQSIIDLRSAIEAAPEMTPEHREQLLALVDSLATEIDSGASHDDDSSEKLRGAIAAAEDAVRKRNDDESHDLKELLSDLEERAEMVALEHPVIANALTAIARLV